MEAQTQARSAWAPPVGMIAIPAGPFLRGPQAHRRSLGEFAIDATPMTNAEYLALAKKHGLRIPQALRQESFAREKADHPVVGLTWKEALRAARVEGLDLPTEDEWEKAARGEDGRRYPWGDSFDGARANTRGSGRFDSTPVGSFPQGASPYGVLDLVGNVWEWTATEAEGGLVRIRGGSWFDPPAMARADRGITARPEFSSASIGFRRVWRPGAVPEVPPEEPENVPRQDWMGVSNLMEVAPDDALHVAELQASMSQLVEQASHEAQRWGEELDSQSIDDALGSALTEDSDDLHRQALAAFEDAIARGDLAQARAALATLERVSPPGTNLEEAALALARSEELLRDAPARLTPRASARVWVWLAATLAVANGVLAFARLSGRL